MSISAPQVAVAVCVEPFLLRSTLHAALAADERFAAYLCPIDADPAVWGPASGARIMLASKPTHRADLCVMLLSMPGGTVPHSGLEACMELTYVDLPSLSGQLIEHGSAFELNDAAS